MAELPQQRSGAKARSLRQVSTPLLVVALVIGASGVGLGVFGLSNILAGKPPAVAILNPSTGDVIAGTTTIRAMVSAAEGDDYTVKVLRNGTQIGTTLPFGWDTTSGADGPYNLTVIITGKHGTATDQVIVEVLNHPAGAPPSVFIIEPDYDDTLSGEKQVRAIVSADLGYSVQVLVNDTEIGTALPCTWDTTTGIDGQYNVTVEVIDGQTRVAQDEVWVNVTNIPLPTRPILEVQQAINTTTFTHQRGNVKENFSTPIWMDVSEGSQLFIQLTAEHWINTSRADNWLFIQLFMNGTCFNNYTIRFQRLPTGGDQDTMTVTGCLQALSAPLSAGTYEIYLTGSHDYLGTGIGAKTTKTTLIAWEIGP